MTDDTTDRPASWAAEEAESSRSGHRWWLVGGAVAIVVALLGAGAIYLALRDTPAKGWPASVETRPEGLGGPSDPATEVTPTAAPGAYVWIDFQGFHLWIVNGGDVGAVSGTIRADEAFATAVPAIPGAGSVTVDGQEATFDLPAEPTLVGIDFNPGFYTKSFTVTLEGADGEIEPAFVTVGTGPPVTELPFEVAKVLESEAADL